jgi:triosephosphate isomerase
MARTPILAGNWKMHCTRAEAATLARALVESVGKTSGREVVIAPTFTALETVAGVIQGSCIRLSAQNVHGEPKGAFTGEVSAAMLKDVGCSHVIIGHSERRQYFGETDTSVNERLKAALGAGLTPIVCVGETLAEREAGSTLDVVERQLRAVLDALASQPGFGAVAYEPVWAIGTGIVASPEDAQEVHARIREILKAASTELGQQTCLLYGGSVNAGNAAALLAQPDIDGALVGGASLDPASFGAILEAAERASTP